MSFLIQQLYLCPTYIRRNPSPLEDLTQTASSQRKQTLDPQQIQLNQKKNERPLNQLQKCQNVLQHYYLNKNTKITLQKKACFNQKSFKLCYVIKLIINQQKYIQIKNRERRLLYFKTISQKINIKTQENILFTFHPYNGMVKIIVFNGYMITNERIAVNWHQIMEKYYCFDIIYDYIILILLGTYIHPDSIANKYSMATHNLRNIEETIKKIGIGVTLPCNSKAQTSILQSYASEKLRKQKIMNNLISLTQAQLLQLSLYCKAPANITSRQLTFSQSELATISTKIRTPTLLKCKNFFQNNCILNYIKINNPEGLAITKINSGGFSTIFVAEIQYWYVFSGSQNQVIAPIPQSNFSRDNMFRKTVVLKKGQNHSQSSRNRILHQMEILKKIKNGNALFIPKYYIPLNENTVKKSLFCDFIPNPNLLEFMYLHKQTLSATSKSLILLMLVQGIRFLSSYDVYHLDLKPNNVMITKSMMIKIIDFGESYHHKVCGQQFVPGFTMPYSSPQNYYPIDLSIFSQKNDIFSFGIIASELMNNRLPFYFFDQENHEDRYTDNNFENYWLYAPQQCEDRNDPFVFMLMQLVIGRCMDYRPQKRPELDWLSLIFRQFLDFYY